MRCLGCLMDSLVPHWDKKGRPYLMCDNCGARFFGRSIKMFPIMDLVSDILEKLGIENVQKVADYYIKKIEAADLHEKDQKFVNEFMGKIGRDGAVALLEMSGKTISDLMES